MLVPTAPPPKTIALTASLLLVGEKFLVETDGAPNKYRQRQVAKHLTEGLISQSSFMLRIAGILFNFVENAVLFGNVAIGTAGRCA
uniref:Uncharacterized protein n=1 Tax=Romanomermis culicivorax TaxID=13658 RepID=A0A915IQC6_ROMCU